MTPGVARWLALLAAAEWWHRTTFGADAQAARRLYVALDILDACEHTLSPDERRLARTVAWHRRGVEPLPDDATQQEWTWCRCRACQLARHSFPPAAFGSSDITNLNTKQGVSDHDSASGDD